MVVRHYDSLLSVWLVIDKSYMFLKFTDYLLLRNYFSSGLRDYDGKYNCIVKILKGNQIILQPHDSKKLQYFPEAGIAIQNGSYGYENNPIRTVKINCNSCSKKPQGTEQQYGIYAFSGRYGYNIIVNPYSGKRDKACGINP